MPANTYAIELKYPQTFDELLFRLAKWRRLKDSLYNMARTQTMMPLVSVDTNTNTKTVTTYDELRTSTLEALDKVGQYYESNSCFSTMYMDNEETRTVQSQISTATPASEKAMENIVFDIQNLYNGVTSILKTYGDYDSISGLWIMKSRISAMKAYSLIISEYPVFPQLIYNFDYPQFPGTLTDMPTTVIVKTVTYKINPNGTKTELNSLENTVNNAMYLYIYNSGLDSLISPASNLFKQETIPHGAEPAITQAVSLSNLGKQGTFKLIYCDSDNLSLIDPVTNYKINNVIDEFNFNTEYLQN